MLTGGADVCDGSLQSCRRRRRCRYRLVAAGLLRHPAMTSTTGTSPQISRRQTIANAIMIQPLLLGRPRPRFQVWRRGDNCPLTVELAVPALRACDVRTCV